MAQGALSEDDVETMSGGGVGTLRMFFAWTTIDPTAQPDDYDWSVIDPVVGYAAERGITALPYLFSTPEWVSELEGGDCGTTCATLAPTSPLALDAWREFAGAAVERYGPEGEFWAENPELPPTPVRTWQIWNEQNSPAAYTPEPDVDAFAELLSVASQEIRDHDPEATVILGGMFATPFQGKDPAITAAEFLRRLYEVPGIEESFDGVAAHPYAARLKKVEAQVEAIHEAVETAGDDAELWITEIGWSSGEGENPLEQGPEGQAVQLRGAYEMFLDRREAWDIRSVVWYSWRDLAAGGICDWCGLSGLFEEAELTPKPAWDAYSALPRSDS